MMSRQTMTYRHTMTRRQTVMRRLSWRRPALAAALSLAAFSNTWAARLPDWAKAIAEGAPAIPEGSSGPTTRVLLDEVRVSIDNSGTMTTRWRSARQVLSSRVSELERQWFPFNQGTHLRTWRGWHLPLGHKAQRAPQEPVELAVGDSFLGDKKARAVSVDGVC